MKTAKECETARTSQYLILFLAFLFISFCLFVCQRSYKSTFQISYSTTIFCYDISTNEFNKYISDYQRWNVDIFKVRFNFWCFTALGGYPQH